MTAQCDQSEGDTQCCGSQEQAGPLWRRLEGFPEEETFELRPKR